MNLEDIFEIGSILESIRLYARLASNDIYRIVALGENGLTTVIQEIQPLLQKHNISLQSYEEIKRAINFLNKNYRDYSETNILEKIISDDSNFNLTIEDAEKLNAKIDIWRDRIINELREIIIFPAYTSGDLNSKKLIQGAESFVEAKVW